MIQCATLGIPKRMKNAISVSVAFCLDLFIRNDNITSEECKTKNYIELVEIFLKLSMKTVQLQVHLIIWTTLVLK